MNRKYKPNTVPLIPTGQKDKDGKPIMMEDWRGYKGPYAKADPKHKPGQRGRGFT